MEEARILLILLLAILQPNKQPFKKYKNNKTEFVDHIKTTIDPKFDKPLVVLVGRWTGSMGEGMASGNRWQWILAR
jgi:hypothetical protein